MQLSTITHSHWHTQVTPMMLLASCLKGVLREHVLTPATRSYQLHPGLSQPIRMAINHTSHKCCHPCTPPPPSLCSSLDSLSVAMIQQMSCLTFYCWHSFSLPPLMSPIISHWEQSVSGHFSTELVWIGGLHKLTGQRGKQVLLHQAREVSCICCSFKWRWLCGRGDVMMK